MPTNSPDITEILQGWSQGRREALDAIVPLVYEELRRQARRHLRRERAGHTLQTTALVNEAYLKLIDQRNVNWQNRAHFFGIAAGLMRRILVDYAKTKQRLKRGGGADNLQFDEALMIETPKENLDLMALNEALDHLAALDEQQARIVELRYFGDLTIEETAEVLGVSTATVKRNWNMARAWLHHELTRRA